MKEKITQHTEDCFVKLLIEDKDFLALVRSVIEPHFFSSQITEDIVEICYSFYDQFKTSPGNHIGDEVIRAIKSKTPEERKLFSDYLIGLSELQVSNKDYVFKRVNDFVSLKRFESAAVMFAELLEENKIDEAKSLMYSTLRKDIIEKDIGIEYLRSDLPNYYFVDDEYFMRTGIEHLDKMIGGFTRSQFVAILGEAKATKTWFCIHLARQAMIRGLNVLHITHEVSAEEGEKRYDMAFGGLTKERKPEPITMLERDDDGKVINEVEIKPDSVFDPKAIKRTRKIVRRFGPRLFIKKYPMGTCTIQEIERYMDHLEIFEKFIPDVLINDYVEIMKLPLPKEEMRHRVNQCYIDHKRIADERKILVITVSQTPKSGFGKKILTKGDFSEDYRKAANVDLAFSISHTKDQERERIARIQIIANRTGPAGMGCIVQQCPELGQFSVKSWVPKVIESREEEEND